VKAVERHHLCCGQTDDSLMWTLLQFYYCNKFDSLQKWSHFVASNNVSITE
jgi:hypothetical protein